MAKKIAKKIPTAVRRDTLQTVTIKSTPVKRPQSVLKGGQQVPTAKVDSIRKANPKLGSTINKPYKGSGGMDTYGPNDSDKIRAALKNRK